MFYSSISISFLSSGDQPRRKRKKIEIAPEKSVSSEMLQETSNPDPGDTDDEMLEMPPPSPAETDIDIDSQDNDSDDE